MPDVPDERSGYCLESGVVTRGARVGSNVEISHGGLDSPSTLRLRYDPFLVYTAVGRVANDYDA